MDVPSTAVAMWSTLDVPTAPRPALRTKLSANSLSATSWRPLLLEISPMLQSTLHTFCPSYTLSCTTVYRAPFTPKWSVTDPEKPERIGTKLLTVFWNRGFNCIFHPILGLHHLVILWRSLWTNSKVKRLLVNNRGVDVFPEQQKLNKCRGDEDSHNFCGVATIATIASSLLESN